MHVTLWILLAKATALKKNGQVRNKLRLTLSSSGMDSGQATNAYTVKVDETYVEMNPAKYTGHWLVDGTLMDNINCLHHLLSDYKHWQRGHY